MQTFEEAYAELNDDQLRAVDIEHVDGPMLVVAGPGTGKTQLLSLRVANILKHTDTLPQNILCLTFTENGALNMRDRLTRFIGKDAYDVNIGTYHAFGADLIRRFPEYFAQTRLENSIDELGKHQIVAGIIDNLSYGSPIKPLRYNLKDVISTISEVKRALLQPADLRAIAVENQTFVETVSEAITDVCSDVKSFPSSFSKAKPLYSAILDALKSHAPTKSVNSNFGSLAGAAILDLQAELLRAEELQKSTPLTEWKNRWIAKNSENNFVLTGRLHNIRLVALADVVEQYQSALHDRGLYDFDDMISRSILALEVHNDLRLSLQEQYLYILLDEFQDTNKSQLRLVELLTKGSTNDSQPNVMAVGDDDQAIYAFQGAQYSNMVDFYNLYDSVEIVSLKENYRSHRDVLQIAQNISAQIEGRLTNHFPQSHEPLQASNKKLPAKATIKRQEFLSDIAENAFVANQIKTLIDEGTDAKQIAVLAPKHKLLESLVPYLNHLDVAVRYDRSENILDSVVIQQLLTMARLVIALQGEENQRADSLWPMVLSFDFWHIDTAQLWQLSWQVSDARSKQLHEGTAVTESWSKRLLASEIPAFANIALLFLRLADLSRLETCEMLLDYLIGSKPVILSDGNTEITSPLREYYTSTSMQLDNPDLFYQTLSELTVLRTRLREQQATRDQALNLHDLILFVNMYADAEVPMLDSSPYRQQANAAQLMTVFKAKGLEFEHVFLISCHDEVWGSKSHNTSNSLALPVNLQPIRHAGASEDERLRILYVALTRAKFGLHLTSHSLKYNGKSTPRLKFFAEVEEDDGTFRAMVLPEAKQHVIREDFEAPAQELLELHWQDRHVAATTQTDLRQLLADRVETYQLSPTHLNSFLNLESYGGDKIVGPERFFFTTILRFPEAPTTDGQFGNAIHETLEWVQHQVSEAGRLPSDRQAMDYFKRTMSDKGLSQPQLALEIERGEAALPTYLKARKHMFKPSDKAESNFRNEGVFVGEAHLSGKIDRLEIDTEAKTITVVDYKTGKSYSTWKSEPKLHRYKQQLYCYKLLIEKSHTFKGYTVIDGRLEFIEPSDDGKINILNLQFDGEESKRTERLLEAMWKHVKACDFPAVDAYADSLTGIKQFEQDLIDDEI